MIAQYDRDAAIETERKFARSPELVTEAEIANVALAHPLLAGKIAEAKRKATEQATPTPAPVAPRVTSRTRTEHLLQQFIDAPDGTTLHDLTKTMLEKDDEACLDATPLVFFHVALTQLKSARIAFEDMTRRVAELEKREAGQTSPLQALKYFGVWSGEKRYEIHDCVTHAGSLWFARQAGSGIKPGDGLYWQLAVKGR